MKQQVIDRAKLNPWCQHHVKVESASPGLIRLKCTHCGVKHLLRVSTAQEAEAIFDSAEVTRQTSRLTHRAREFNSLKPYGESVYWTGRSYQRKFGEGRRATGSRLHGKV